MQSMTGYGKETSRQGDWEMTVELRTIAFWTCPCGSVAV